MFIVVTLLCLTVAPLLPELNHAQHVAGQVKIIEEMGGRCVFVDRPLSFAGGLVRRLWPVKVEHLEHNLLMAEFHEKTVDLTKLQQVTDVRGLCLNKCQLTGTAKNERLIKCNQIEYLQIYNEVYDPAERDSQRGWSLELPQPFPSHRTDGRTKGISPAILSRLPSHFPRLQKGQLFGMPAEQEFIDCLANCASLCELDVLFKPQLTDVSSAPLQKLLNLRVFRIDVRCGKARHAWDWEFLSRLRMLEEVRLQCGLHKAEYHRLSGPDRNHLLPSAVLPSLPKLREINLVLWSYQPPAYDVTVSPDHFQSIINSCVLESWRFTHDHQLDDLKSLQSAKRLRKLTGAHLYYLDEAALFAALSKLSELRELEIDIGTISAWKLQRLHELDLDRLWLRVVFERTPPSDQEVELLMSLPVTEFGYYTPHGFGNQSLSQWVEEKSERHAMSDDGLRFLTQPRP